jgi:VanZ family protein
MKDSLRRIMASPATRWCFAAAWAAVIFAGSSVPGSRIPGGYSVYGHLTEYFVLGALVAFAFGGRKLSGVAAALLVCALYAASDELHQAFVPMRTPDPLDWLTDLVGATAGALSTVRWSLGSRGRAGDDRQ